jgi:predicted glycosyltransferase
MHGVAEELKQHEHTVHFSVRDIPVAKRLMEYYGMTPWVDLGDKKDTLTGKAKTVLKQDLQLLRYVRNNHIDLGLSSGIVLSHVSKLTSMKAFVFDDDDDAAEPLLVKYGHPLSDVVFTPDCIRRKTPHAVYYHGTHELAYLHPKRFLPDPAVLQQAGIQESERFFVMRFVAMKGHHDVGQQGLTLDQKEALVNLLKPHGRVIITSERAIEPEFEQYRLPVPPEDIHSLMAYSSMFVGDSQTMTSEAAVLGVPALKCNTFAGRLSVPNMLEQQYGLCHAYTPEQFGDMYSNIEQLLAKDPTELKTEWQAKRQKMLSEMIDPTEFFVNYIENHEGLS